jgi:hypothetical protein
MQNDIQFIPSFSLSPNKLVSFNTVFKKSIYTGEWLHSSKFRVYKNENSENELIKKDVTRLSHNLKISENAYRTLKKKINWLYYLSESKNIKTPKGSNITNFKLAFITLTLPATQKENTSEITSTMLNQFLTELRTRFFMQNYVWRLEFQKNGNVHYHIVTDTYIDFYIMKSIWNRILYKKGYIKDYQTKMNSLTLADYFKNNYQSKANLFDKCKDNFAKGKRENWTNPPSINVKSVISNKSISGYLSKYFAKNKENNPILNKLDTFENTKNMRLWFCSRGLSKLNAVSEFCEAVEYDIFAIISYAKELNVFKTEYAEIISFELNKCVGNCRKWLDRILTDYAIKQGYFELNAG